MELNKEEWWPTPIYHLDIHPSIIDNSVLEQEIKQHQEIDPGRQRSNRGGYQSNDVDVTSYPELTKLKNIVESCFSSCFNDWKITNHENHRITNIWININKFGDSNLSHIHPQSLFSAVYYVKTNSSHPPLCFESPCAQNFLLSSITDSETVYTYNTIHYEVFPGKLIIFPSWLFHYVDAQTINEERISVAFNSRF
jgi:uncharacterized protein (TIGR02466 family)